MPGGSVLAITDEIDKIRFGRELPLTEGARQALESVCPESGPIFGKHDYRDQLRKAAAKSVPPEQAKTFTAYDLRHARATEWAESGNLVGVAHHRAAVLAPPNARTTQVSRPPTGSRTEPRHQPAVPAPPSFGETIPGATRNPKPTRPPAPSPTPEIKLVRRGGVARAKTASAKEKKARHRARNGGSDSTHPALSKAPRPPGWGLVRRGGVEPPRVLPH